MIDTKISVIYKTKRKEIFLLLLWLFIGFALRFYTFDHKSLWLDEIHTFNDSRDDLKGQLKFYKENPGHLHPPLFLILTHLFYPFPKPERDLRIIPLIFGILSIPMLYFLAKLFSPTIALLCTFSLTFMTYHIYLSQEGRHYSLIMFLGMAGLYCFMKYLKTSKRGYLVLVALLFATLFHTSYSSIPFIILSQFLWFYRPDEEDKKFNFPSFLFLNGLMLLLCLPWLLFVIFNYKGAPLMDPRFSQGLSSFLSLLYGVLHDWVPHTPLMIVSVILLILSPIFSKFRKNAFILLAIFVLPIGGVYLFCKLSNVTHFVTSRYFINFLPLFLIAIFLSLESIENNYKKLKKLKRLRFLFAIFFIASNLVILPLYYQSEKQNLKGLATYLKGQLQDGDKIIVGSVGLIPGLLHYFEIYPEKRPEYRHHFLPFRMVSEKEPEYIISLFNQKGRFIISYSKTYWLNYLKEENRSWIVVDKKSAKEIKKYPSFVLKGYFDGSFLNFDRFPTDASMYLFLWDPRSQDEKRIDMPIE